MGDVFVNLENAYRNGRSHTGTLFRNESWYRRMFFGKFWRARSKFTRTEIEWQHYSFDSVYRSISVIFAFSYSSTIRNLNSILFLDIKFFV